MNLEPNETGDELPVPADVLLKAVSEADWFDALDLEVSYSVGKHFQFQAESFNPHGLDGGRHDSGYYYTLGGQSMPVSYKPSEIVSAMQKAFAGAGEELAEKAASAVREAASDYLASDENLTTARSMRSLKM